MSDRCLLTVHAHPDDEASKGAPDGGPLSRRRGAHGARVLHRWRGRRHPQPGDGHPGGAGPAARGASGGAGCSGRDDRLRRGGHARLPRLGHARLTRQRPTGLLRQRRPRRGRRSPGGGHPPGAAAGDRHLWRRSQGYPHPDHLRVHDISHPGIRAGRRSRRGTPRRASRGPRSKLYYVVWSRARIVATHAKFEELGLESPFDDGWFDRPSQDDASRPGSTSGRLRTTSASTACWPTRPRSTLNRRSGSGCPATRPAPCTRGTTTCWPQSRVESQIPEDDLFAGID